ncbi:MAG TPA: hypothetical protein VNG90_03945, partial [Candidatus Acidoferrum sp.]|nr:hypothetical protein [Candidatus Acidoferrum sp.]
LFDALTATEPAREARVRSIITTLEGLVFTSVDERRQFVTVNRDLVRWNSRLGENGLFAISVSSTTYACLLVDAWGDNGNPNAKECLAGLFPKASSGVVTRALLAAELGLSRTNITSALRKAFDVRIFESLPIAHSTTEQIFFHKEYAARPILMEIVMAAVRWAALPETK